MLQVYERVGILHVVVFERETKSVIYMYRCKYLRGPFIKNIFRTHNTYLVTGRYTKGVPVVNGRYVKGVSFCQCRQAGIVFFLTKSSSTVNCKII